MKKIIAFLPATLLAANPVLAGPYVNVEANSGFVGSGYGGTVIDNHIGYEGDNWYIQGGPAVILSDGADSELQFSGKVGANAPLSETLALYGEVSALTAEADNSYGTKAGLKWTF